jgi:DNA-binding NtrC family response regulator
VSYLPKILIVDDERTLCNSLKVFLSNQDCEIVTAYAGREAIEKLCKDTFDVVLLDMVMADMSGHQIIEYMHENGLDALIIAMTGYSSTDISTEFFRGKIYGCLKKPFDLDELVTTVAGALDKKRTKNC